MIETAEPTPITQELLLKAGFKISIYEQGTPDEDVFYYRELSDNKHCDLSFITGDKNGMLEVCLFPYEDYFRFKYVHELQNVFYALTGEELIIEV